MKSIFLYIFVCLIASHSVLFGTSNTFLDYQNYNHGYCPDCNCYPCKCSEGCPPEDASCNTCPKPDPCCPPATGCATQCGLNIWYLGFGLAGIAAVAVVIISSDNGSVHSH